MLDGLKSVVVSVLGYRYLVSGSLRVFGVFQMGSKELRLW